jgi:uncharacterized protein (DUF433 family)
MPNPFELTTNVPIEIDKYGVYRVTGSRLTLDLVVHTFNLGSTAEEIVQTFPTLKLHQAYLIIGFYLLNKKKIDSYLRKQNEKAEAYMKKIESKQDLTEIRKRLALRRKAKRKSPSYA